MSESIKQFSDSARGGDSRPTYPWPVEEHLDKPTTLDDLIRAELNLYRSGEEFRQGIVAIGRIYGKLPMFQSIQNNARVMALALVANGYEGYRNTFDTDFYRGSILGMHVVLQLQSRRTRSMIKKSHIWD